MSEMADQVLDQVSLAIPESGQQFAFFLGRQQVGREGDGWLERRRGSVRPWRLAALLRLLWLHDRPSHKRVWYALVSGPRIPRNA